MNFLLCRPAVTDRIRSDLVTTKDCSPTRYEYLLEYSDLHAPMQVKIILKLNEFSTLPFRCD